MRIQRVGRTLLKGAQHLTLDAIELTATGPRGDRQLCLVDPARARVLRTVENPSLLQARVTLDGDVLSIDLPGGRVTGVPEPTGSRMEADYWGRLTSLELLAGPWAPALSRHLGREVVLARVRDAGGVVYGAPVSIVTTSSLASLEQLTGGSVADARFRATFTVDTGTLPPHVELTWGGRDLRVGDARVRVRGPVPRCAVVDLEPSSGERDRRVLAALAEEGPPVFGVDAVVVAPGRVRPGDDARLL